MLQRKAQKPHSQATGTTDSFPTNPGHTTDEDKEIMVAFTHELAAAATLVESNRTASDNNDMSLARHAEGATEAAYVEETDLVGCGPALTMTSGATSNNNNRRQLLVRVGSWMKNSWRNRSSRSMASMSSATSIGDLKSVQNRSDDFDEDDMKPSKNVQFEDDDFLVTVIPSCDEDSSLDWNEDMEERWFQVRFPFRQPRQ